MPESTERLRLLHLEDSELDHELVLAHLLRSGLKVEVERVETRAEFEAALESRWDAIVSDYSLPDLSGIDALRIVRGRDALLPFLLVSGEIGEDTAVAAMRGGASDYLLKNNLARLVPALEHAVDAARTAAARQRADRELAASRERLADLARHLQNRIEAERSAIAREIHDDVGGSLTAVKFDIDWIRRHSRDPAVQQRAASALETVSHAIGASQRVMHNLRPAILEQGLVPALQWLASRFEKRTGVECHFRTSDESIGTPDRPLPEGVPLVAYRTAQEALTNISKHAQATRVTIDLSASGGVLSLELSDNGRGLSRDDLAKATSFGIRGLHERASTVGGWVDLSSHPGPPLGPDAGGGRPANPGPGGPGSRGGGTTLILSIPLDSPHGAATMDRDDGGSDNREHDPSSWTAL